MRERVEMLGGRFLVASEAGAGLRFEARVPIAERAA
jgi:signal transduction histidine kinase